MNMFSVAVVTEHTTSKPFINMIINFTRAEKEIIRHFSDRQSGEIDDLTAFHL